MTYKIELVYKKRSFLFFKKIRYLTLYNIPKRTIDTINSALKGDWLRLLDGNGQLIFVNFDHIIYAICNGEKKVFK